MTPDDRDFRREMASAYRSGWQFIDLATAIPHAGDSLMVTLFGQPIVVVREEDEDVRAYRCLRRPRGAPQPVRCEVRYGMVFVNLDQRDHQLFEPDITTATPPQCLTRFPRRCRSLRRYPHTAAPSWT
ncbi:(2Fe-2S)-binding protein [Streptomyces goshikiensis]